MQEANAPLDIPLTPVTSSSNVTGFGYHAASRVLVVAFKSGGQWEYPGVPPEVHQGFIEAESKGSYFAKHVAPFKGVKRPPVDKAADTSREDDTRPADPVAHHPV
jgi:hypothetical protein